MWGIFCLNGEERKRLEEFIYMMPAKDSIGERQRQRVGDRKLDAQRQSSGVFRS
jgi:hypothetical protein